MDGVDGPPIFRAAVDGDVKWVFKEGEYWYVSSGRSFNPAARSLRTLEDPRSMGLHSWQQFNLAQASGKISAVSKAPMKAILVP